MKQTDQRIEDPIAALAGTSGLGAMDVVTDGPTVDPGPTGGSGVDPAPDAPSERVWWRRFLDLTGWPTACFVVSRFVMFCGVVVLGYMVGYLRPALVLRQWDGEWYSRIVIHGYPKRLHLLPHPLGRIDVSLNRFPFFPGYPLVSRAVMSVLPVGPLAAGELVSLAFGLVTTVLFFVYARRRFGRTTAEQATLLFAVFPGAWVLGFPYAESMMLTFALLCLLALDRRWWVWAGAAAAVATFTRPNAVFLVAACAWAAFFAIRERREWRALWAPTLAPVGILVYFSYLAARTGNFFMWSEAERRAWGERFDFGARVLHQISLFAHHPLSQHRGAVVTLSVVVTVLGFVALFRVRLPGPDRIYAIGIAGLPLVSHILVARPRFLFTAFPLVLALAAWIPKRWVPMVAACSAVLMVLLVVYYGYYSGAVAGFIPP